LSITKGGANEGLKVNKTSGSGNAATIIGTLEATTLVKTGGTSTQFLMADGSTNTLNQASILSKLGWFNIVNQVAGTVSSGTANTITKSIALPSVPNVLNFRVVFSKTGTNANWIVRAYVSEVDNNIGGTAVLIATSPLAGGSITYLPIKRTVDFIAGNIITINQTTATLTDDAQATSRLNTAFPTGTPLYLIFAVQCTSGSDSARFETCMINNFTF
jgi:hypothetical protein